MRTHFYSWNGSIGWWVFWFGTKFSVEANHRIDYVQYSTVNVVKTRLRPFLHDSISFIVYIYIKCKIMISNYLFSFWNRIFSLGPMFIILAFVWILTLWRSFNMKYLFKRSNRLHCNDNVFINKKKCHIQLNERL